MKKKKNAFTTWLFYLSESQMFFQLERLNQESNCGIGQMYRFEWVRITDT